MVNEPQSDDEYYWRKVERAMNEATEGWVLGLSDDEGDDES